MYFTVALNAAAPARLLLVMEVLRRSIVTILTAAMLLFVEPAGYQAALLNYTGVLSAK